jgi:hypothetical protein
VPKSHALGVLTVAKGRIQADLRYKKTTLTIFDNVFMMGGERRCGVSLQKTFKTGEC